MSRQPAMQRHADRGANVATSRGAPNVHGLNVARVSRALVSRVVIGLFKSEIIDMHCEVK